MDFSDKYVRPLGLARNEFISLLLTKFQLTREDEKTRLSLHFDVNTPCIWLRKGKRHVKDVIPDFATKEALYRQKLRDFLAVRSGELEYFDPEFPFRYVSGGALPVITFGDREYFCLIYRQYFPVGWNLANGGSDATHELVDPFITVERELREELLVLDPINKHRYVFSTETDNPLDMPEYMIARRLWRDKLQKQGWPDIEKFKPTPIPIKWLDGPDSLCVTMGTDPAVITDGCYLNIRAEDFGIEVDRIAKLKLEEDVILLDGEIVNGCLVNSILGLFEVQRTVELIARGKQDFEPDIFFYDGCRYDNTGKEAFQKIVSERFVPRMDAILPEWDRSEWDRCPHPFDLCPVTRGIIERVKTVWHPAEKPTSTSDQCDVFISFAHQDAKLAREVCEHLKGKGLKVFFSQDSRLSDYSRAIDASLEKATCLVVVGSSVDNLQRDWPQYEYRSFHIMMKAKRKPSTAQIVSYLSGVDPQELPLPLLYYQAVIKEEEREPLSALTEYVMVSLPGTPRR